MLQKILVSILFLTSFTMVDTLQAQEVADNDLNLFDELYDSAKEEIQQADTLVIDTTLNVSDMKFPKRLFGQLVYDHFKFSPYNSDSISMRTAVNENSIYTWINRQKTLSNAVAMLKQRTMFSAPSIVPYNENTLPDPPKEYHAKVDPRKATIIIEEGPVDRKNVKDAPKPVDIKRKNWLHDFEASLHFSQAYNSPNWYQGGNNNLNIICQGMHNVKLNRAFHPNLLFENTIQYKLALNSAPEDSLRNYSISEDLFQINTKFGVRAAKDWFYSITTMFKTQLLNNYKSNSNDLKAAFLSPGELNVGLGMSYSHTNAKKTFTFDTSISPLSYNLKICTNERLNKEDFGIEQYKSTASQYGSNAEAKIKWQMAYNIAYTSRMYLFTDYTYVQGDWEHTIAFAVNKYLSTQIYVHLRYDSSTPRIENSKWHTWQLKEILSFGLTYKFATV